MELRTDRYKLKELFPDRAKKYAQQYHVKADELEYIVKGIPIDPADISIEEGERAAIRLVTTPRLDRDNEILLPDGALLDDFRQSPSVLFGHQYDKLPIGKDVWIKVGKKGILAKTVYANHQFAEDVFQCVKGGFLNSNSVGFMPLERVSPGDSRHKDIVDKLEKDYGIPREEAKQARTIYTKWLMLEHSDVPVPSNAASLNVAVSKGMLKVETPTLREALEIDVAPEAGPPADIPPSENTEGPDVKAPDVVTKPEVTEDYIRIPVSTGHDGHKIRTITVSEAKAIKALYCVDCKEIATYLFDKDKWSKADAEAWVEEHKKTITVSVTDTAVLVGDAEGTPEAPVAKMFDTEQNPSIGDIQCAVYIALNPEPAEDSVYASSTWIMDLYPVDYPSGHVVYGKQNDDGSFGMFLCDYTYENDSVTLGEKHMPVVQAYARRRGGKGFDAQIAAFNAGCAAALDHIMAKVIDELKAAEVTVAEPVALASDTLTLDPSPDIEIEETANCDNEGRNSHTPPEPPANGIEIEGPKAATVPDPNADLAALIKDVDWAGTIRDVVKVEIARARGRLL